MISLLAASLAISGCGGSKEAPEATGGETPSPIGTEPIELTFYSQYTSLLSELSDTGFMNDFGQFINKKYPNITFKTVFGATTKETLQTVVASKTPIDFVQVSPVGTHDFIDLGVGDDISDLIQKYRVDLSKVEPSVLDLMTKAGGGKLIGLPYQSNSLILFYNKDVFDKFGVSYPKDNLTWADTADLARRTTRLDGGVEYLGFGNQQDWNNVLRSNQLSLEPIDLKTNKSIFANSEWRNLFEQLRPVLQVPGNEGTLGAGKSVDYFIKERRLAMVLGYPDFYQRIPADMNWDMTTAPQLAERPGVNFAPVPIVLAPVAYSNKRDAAFLAITSMLSEEVQLMRARKYGIASVLTDAKMKEEIGAEVAMLQGKNRNVMQPANMAKSITFTPYTSAAMSGISKALTETMTGAKDANTALREQAEAADKKIAELMESRGAK